MKIARRYIAPLTLLPISVIVTVYGASLFMQTFPAVGTVTLTANCSTLTISAKPAAGSSGSIEYDCSGASPFGTTAAVTLANMMALTPQFTLPAGYTDLWINGGLGGATSAPCAGGIGLPGGPIASGTAVVFNNFGQRTVGAFDYCVDFTSFPNTGLPTFTITWTISGINGAIIPFYQISQTFPATTSVAATANCSTLTANDTLIVAGSSGVVKFDCSGASTFGTTPAFLVTAGSTLTPTFTLTGTGYTALAVIRSSVPTESCISSVAIASATPVTLAAPSYDYCASFTGIPTTGLNTFTVSWG